MRRRAKYKQILYRAFQSDDGNDIWKKCCTNSNKEQYSIKEIMAPEKAYGKDGSSRNIRCNAPSLFCFCGERKKEYSQ